MRFRRRSKVERIARRHQRKLGDELFQLWLDEMDRGHVSLGDIKSSIRGVREGARRALTRARAIQAGLLRR